jgi:hypothetical protein
MFSHVVIFWTDPSKPDAGKMATSHRDVVDQTYQVALNIQFQSKQAQDEYQNHPQHVEFVERCKPLFAKVIIYDFE